MKKSKTRGVRISLLKDERGLSTVEYVILLVLIAVVGITAWTTFGEKIETSVGDATEVIP